MPSANEARCESLFVIHFVTKHVQMLAQRIPVSFINSNYVDSIALQRIWDQIQKCFTNIHIMAVLSICKSSSIKNRHKKLRNWIAVFNPVYNLAVVIENWIKVFCCTSWIIAPNLIFLMKKIIRKPLRWKAPRFSRWKDFRFTMEMFKNLFTQKMRKIFKLQLQFKGNVLTSWRLYLKGGQKILFCKTDVTGGWCAL